MDACTRLGWAPISALLLTAVLFSGCFLRPEQTTAGTKPFGLRVSWAASTEARVNSIGGGYRVYYSVNPITDVSKAVFIDVPYVSGTAAPTSVEIPNLSRRLPARYYIRVSSFGPRIGSTVATVFSEPSDQVGIGVP